MLSYQASTFNLFWVKQVRLIKIEGNQAVNERCRWVRNVEKTMRWICGKNSWVLLARIRVATKDIYEDKELTAILSEIEKFFEKLKKEHELEYFVRG